jgi:hypothetical protein
MMRKLIIEFSDELTALGVKVDQLDERVAVLEKDLGGWSMAGELQFDLKFTGDNETYDFYADDANIVGKNDFDLNRYRLFIRKRIDENTRFTLRVGTGSTAAGSSKPMRWERYFVTTKLPYDIDFTVGRQAYDLEGDLGLYNDNDSWAADDAYDSLSFTKSWGVADLFLLAARQNDVGGVNSDPLNKDNVEQFMFAANINANFSERFRAGLLGYWLMTDEEIDTAPGAAGGMTDHDLSMYGVYAGFKFTPDIELKGIYYGQSTGSDRPGYLAPGWNGAGSGADDSSSAWKVMLDVGQDTLKFTSLWLEYGQMDNNFEILGGLNPYAWYGAEILAARPYGSNISDMTNGAVSLRNNNTTTIWLISAAQQWNDKWDTLLRYAKADFDTQGIRDASNWTFEVGYQYTPAIKFVLGYDNIDYGDYRGDGIGLGDESDHMIRFRTFVSF